MRHFIHACKLGLCLATIAVIICLAVPGFALQSKPEQSNPFGEELNKYPGLNVELGRLTTRLAQEIKMPAPRSQSRLLPLLPESTTFFAAVPNYGDALHQALLIFQEERKQSAPLNDWWQDGAMSKDAPAFESNLEKVYQLSQFLGDEIVISGGGKDKESDVLILAAIKKPGIRAFLAKLDKDWSGKSSTPLQIYDPLTLATAKPAATKDQMVVLVRPDFLAVSFDLATLRRLNKQLDLRGGRFANTPFGARLNRAYETGTEILAGIDLQKFMPEISKDWRKSGPILDATGFADAKFLIWEQKDVPGQAPNHAELSFTGPRHGIPSWLATPGHMGGLDFVSPQTPMAFAFRLKNPALIFDDLKNIDSAAGSNSMASISQMEAGLNTSLREALLSKLSGEMVFEMNTTDPKDPAWKIILRASDPDGLIQTLNMLQTAMTGAPKSHLEDGVTYYSVATPGNAKPPDVNYAMVDGYLVVASSHDSLAEAIKIHRSGDSLGRSNALHAAMPQGYPVEASALVYQNIGPMLAPLAKQLGPDMASLLPQLMMANKPSVGAMYGEETVIRQASNNNGMSVGAIMVIAAIAIPNLLRSRMAANESAAASTLRVIHTAQVTYTTAYPDRGYAPGLATLGPGSTDCSSSSDVSADHACLLDEKLGGPSCTAGTWCVHSGYRFSMSASCKDQLCDDYVAVATPVESSTGAKSFCSTTDGVIRSQSGPALAAPITAEECAKWAPVQ